MIFPMDYKRDRVFVGMSGGVDSSVAAMLLKRRGYDVTGVFMRCWGGGSPSRSLGITPSLSLGVSCEEKDAEDARRVAEHLGIPFYTWDFEEEYKKRVVEYMIQGYKKGITPNPDVECNREIKFGLFLERALKMGADFVATGHYVRLVYSRGTTVLSAPAAESPLPLARLAPTSRGRVGDQAQSSSESSRLNKPRFSLLTAKDGNKDQSYFLWTLTQEQLKHCLFPIGDYLKPQVREMARKAGLPTAEKKDSQGICFLGKVSLDDFLKMYLKEKKGEVLDTHGKKLGEHMGAHFYTIGQRQGIGNLKHQKGVKLHKPLYVVSKNVKKNEVVVAEEGDPDLARKEVGLTGINFINPEHSSILQNVGMLEVMARVRYRQKLVEAKIRIQKSKFILEFNKPQKFIAAGQSAVFYVADENPSVGSGRHSSNNSELRMLGGGVILG